MTTQPFDTEYVVGFLFAPTDGIDLHTTNSWLTPRRVALIRKKRPKWQRGRLNGIGGHIEKNESPWNAMRREFAEETGVLFDGWKVLLTLTDYREGNLWRVHFFYGQVPSMDVLHSVRSVTDERVEIVPTYPLPPDTLPQLHWIIPLALDDDVRKPIELENVGGN